MVTTSKENEIHGIQSFCAKKMPPPNNRGDTKSRYHPNSPPARHLRRPVTGAPVPVIPGDAGSGSRQKNQGLAPFPSRLRFPKSALFPQCLCISPIFYHILRKCQWLSCRTSGIFCGGSYGSGTSVSGSNTRIHCFAALGSFGSRFPGSTTNSSSRP